MTLQKLDKQKNIRNISLQNKCLAYLWSKNHSHLKFIDYLITNLNQSGKNFVILWENLDFFFAVKEKYEDISEARDFINEFLQDKNTSGNYHHTFFLWNFHDMEDIIKSASNSDNAAINKLVNRFLMYKSAFELLLDVVTKTLTGYTFDTAYFELTNKSFPDDISDTSEAHAIFANYFRSEKESEYEFEPYRLDSTSEYLLGSDVSTLTDIISEMTDVNIPFYDVVPVTRDGKIFNEPEREFSRKARLYEFDDKPNITFGDLKIVVSPEKLDKDIYVCSIYFGNFDGKLDTFSKDTEATAEDVVNSIKNLLNKDIYIHTKQRDAMSDYIEISWIESL